MSKEARTRKAASSPDEKVEPLVPKYRIVEQGVFDIAEHTLDITEPSHRRPTKLIVHINLDLASAEKLTSM